MDVTDENVIGHPEGVPDPRLGARLVGVLEHSRERGFLGPGPISTHVRNARAFLPFLSEPVTGERSMGSDPGDPRVSGWSADVTTDRNGAGRLRVMDLGSGGGVPGLVVGVLRPDLELTLLDGSTTRCSFLDEAVADLEVGDRISVRCGRAEDAGRDGALRSGFRAVMARSFAGPAVTAECAAPFLEPGGLLLVSEPPDVGSDDGDSTRWPETGLAVFGLTRGPLIHDAASSIQVLVASSPCPDAYPRRVGVPSKRPVF